MSSLKMSLNLAMGLRTVASCTFQFLYDSIIEMSALLFGRCLLLLMSVKGTLAGHQTALHISFPHPERDLAT